MRLEERVRFSERVDRIPGVAKKRPDYPSDTNSRKKNSPQKGPHKVPGKTQVNIPGKNQEREGENTLFIETINKEGKPFRGETIWRR